MVVYETDPMAWMETTTYLGAMHGSMGVAQNKAGGGRGEKDSTRSTGQKRGGQSKVKTGDHKARE